MSATVSIFPTTSSAAATGGLSLIESASFTGTTKTFSSLNGDSDGYYVFFYELLGDANGLVAELRPNAVTTNLSVFKARNNGGALAAESATTWTLGSSGTASTRISGWAIILARTGMIRSIHMGGAAHQTALEYQRDGSGIWNESATNITSFALVATTGTFSGATRASLYKMVP